MLIQSSASYQTINLNFIDHERTPLLTSRKERKIANYTIESTWEQLKKNQWVSLVPSIVLGLIIWFGVKPNQELTATAIHLLAVFVR
ncbi:hypothetical protein RMCBS344292_03120 [Rhizopus microsporus]|nr:hypothetical protein RMCBS344292_03120 [Rhizopus microsporus]